MRIDFDYIVIGSGFGGSVSALRLAEKGYKVCVLERGKRYRAQDFAKTNWNLRRYLWLPLLKCFGIQNLSLFRHVLVLSGCGVGGGSLVYANTLLEPGENFYRSPAWAGLADWKAELAPHYITAKRMLGVARNPKLTEVDEALREVAREMARESTFKPVDVGVYFAPDGKEGQRVSDPYFGGQGPERAGCIYCGGCMVGCRHGAKNSLDQNYLFFAEKAGAEVRPETEVVDIVPEEGGYAVHTRRSTAWLFRRPQVLRAKGVVVSAGVLGTLRLLFRCRDVTGSLRKISPTLGNEIRTNCEALIGVTTRDSKKDFSKGIAISSGFYADEHTHIEPVRYSRGSSFMKLLAAPMVDDGNRFTRPLKLLGKFFGAMVMRPAEALRLIFNFRWAESTIILLVMQNLDNRMRFRWKRGLLTWFRKGLVTEQNAIEKIPSFIAIGHIVARKLAAKVNGVPQSAINEVLLQVPTTAHILGGCCIGKSESSGVINSKHEVFGYKNLYVCDGSVIPANLGVNPSLTITAMTERCMSFIPKA